MGSRAPLCSTVLFNASGSTKLINAGALNGSPSFSLTLNKEWSKLIVVVDHTNVAATDITTTVTATLDGSVSFTPQSGAISAGTRTLSNLTDSKTVSADVIFSIEYDVRGYQSISITFDGTSSGATDLIDVYAIGIVGY